MLATAPLFLLAVVATLANALRGARTAQFGAARRGPLRALGLRTLTFILYLLQPAARLRGRLANGLAPWRWPERLEFAVPVPRRRAIWSQEWTAPDERLRQIGTEAGEHGTRVITGGVTDRWDLEIRGGALGAARLRSVTEEHGRGHQLRRFEMGPLIPRALMPTLMMLFVAGGAAMLSQAFVAGGLMMAIATCGAAVAFCECGVATATALRSITAPAEPTWPMLQLVRETTRR